MGEGSGHRMRTSLNVNTRAEGVQIRRALADPQVRAFVLVMGTLFDLPTDRSRERILRFVDDKLKEDNAQYVSVFKAT